MKKQKRRVVVRTMIPAFRRARRYEQLGLVLRSEGQLILSLQGFYKARTYSARKEVIEMKRTCHIQFCSETERWLVHGVYARPASLHCGACFEMLIERSYFPCRIEWDGNWLVIFDQSNIGNLRFHLHPKCIYPARIS